MVWSIELKKKSKENKTMYTEFQLLQFAAYRAQYADPSKDNYKDLNDCLYDWKKENQIKKDCENCTRGFSPECGSCGPFNQWRFWKGE